MFDPLERWASLLEEHGHDGDARRCRDMIARAEACWLEWWNTPLTYAEAQEWSGYDDLRRQVKKKKVPQTPDGRFRRRHLPVKPGHFPPLGLDDVDEAGEQRWANGVRERREAS